MKNYKIKNSFVGPEGPKVRTSKTGINFMIHILISIENCLKYDDTDDFNYGCEPVPANINRFRSQKITYFLAYLLFSVGILL